MEDLFWQKLEALFNNSKIIIDRPKGSFHPRYTEVQYPLDYGYLEGTSGGDGGGIDVWLGTKKDKQIDFILCTIDMLKKDTEIKLLCGCTIEDKDIIMNFYDSNYMSAICIPNPKA